MTERDPLQLLLIIMDKLQVELREQLEAEARSLLTQLTDYEESYNLSYHSVLSSSLISAALEARGGAEIPE